MADAQNSLEPDARPGDPLDGDTLALCLSRGERLGVPSPPEAFGAAEGTMASEIVLKRQAPAPTPTAFEDRQ